MELKERLNNDLKDAMRQKDTIRLNTIRSINTAITNAEKSGKSVDHIQILSTLAKQRSQSIEIYSKNNQTDLAETEQKELDIINQYLPKKLTESEIKEVLTELISNINTPVQGSAIGKVMTDFKSLYPGQDMQLVAKTMKSML